MTSADGCGDGALKEIRADIVEGLRGRRAEIEEVIFARVRDLAPGAVGLADPEYVVELRAAITAVVDFVLRGIEGAGESSSPQVPSSAAAQARRAARDRMGLYAVLRPYLDGYALLEDFVIQQAEQGDFMGQTAALRRVLGISASLLDRVVTSITSTYMEEGRAGETLTYRKQ